MTFRFASIVAAAAVAISVQAAHAAEYVIDTKGAHASINFKIKHLGYSWLTGRFDKFDGTFTYDPAKPEASAVSVVIDTSSVNTNHSERDKHLKSKDFLNVEKFPTAKFESKAVKVGANGKADIIGDLTLNGVTKSVTIAADRIGGGKDPWGGTREGFTGTTTLALKDYNINFALGPASENVELTLNVEGVMK